jgi:uncharacterized protein (DUF433 family)
MVVRRASAAERIVRNPRVLGGEPIVRGMRIPVRSVVLAWREYGGPDGVFGAYPQLGSADVRAALTYYEAHAAEIDRYLRDNLTED